jgi:GC-rich sequence DNA-binding factor
LFEKGWTDCRDAASCVMRDAGSEYASIAPVKTRAEDWKRRFPKTYKDAWMSHAAPTLFAPFARLELLSWSPLFVPGGGDGPAPPLDGMAWYTELLEYGGAVDAHDPDGNLVPTLVEKLVAPTVARAAESSWDPASAAQSRRLAGVVKDLLVYLDPRTCDVMARVLVAVVRRLRETAETRCDIPGWAPVATSAAPAAAAHVRRQFGVALRCARAATAWTGILPASDLAAVVRDAIFAQRVAPHLRLALARPGECLEGLERVAAAAPREWLESVRAVAATLGQIARASPEAHSAAAAAADPVGALDPARLVRALAAVGEFDEAAAVAKLFGVSAKDGAR